MWDDISYPFPNVNGAAVEVWEWISNSTPHFKMDIITYARVKANLRYIRSPRATLVYTLSRNTVNAWHVFEQE